MRLALVSAFVISLALSSPVAAPGSAQEPVRYVVRVDDPTTRLYHVEAEMRAAGDTTRISLPAWTPGHYTLENYARYVRDFYAEDAATDRPLDWDKTDKDTWRVVSDGVGRVRIGFAFWADTVGLSQSLLRDDFGFFNGTNLFVYPEGSDYEFPATLSLELPEGWRVATELTEAAEAGTYRARSYHELVDNPTFVGDFALDSVMAGDRWIRLAVYPARFYRDPAKRMALEALEKIASYQQALFGGAPYDRYTTLVYLATEPIGFAGGLEHAESHLDVLPAPAFQQAPFAFPLFFYRLVAHEYYHTWNVKRIRPAELWPYAYDREQFTPLLWVSEGITDYYAQLTVVRTGLGNEAGFWDGIQNSITQVENDPIVAVEDASLETWIDPTDISQSYYYDKGLLLGLMLDIQIRHATGNRHSLDDVMGRLYREHFQQDRGFTTDDFLGYVAEHVEADWLGDFYERYVDGRDPLPYGQMLARGGVTYAADTVVEPFFGIALASQGGQPVVSFVEPGSAADEAGLQPGDVLLRIGTVQIEGGNWAGEFRRTYADSAGVEISVAYRRNDEELTGRTTIRTRTRVEHRVRPAEDAGESARAIRDGIVTGATSSE